MMCEDRVAIVTGAAGSGMGRSIALTLAREGAKVIISYRSSEDSARAIVDYIRTRTGAAIAVQGYVFEADGCKKLVDMAIDHFNQIDICVTGPGAGWRPRARVLFKFQMRCLALFPLRSSEECEDIHYVTIC